MAQKALRAFRWHEHVAPSQFDRITVVLLLTETLTGWGGFKSSKTTSVRAKNKKKRGGEKQGSSATVDFHRNLTDDNLAKGYVETWKDGGWKQTGLNAVWAVHLLRGKLVFVSLTEPDAIDKLSGVHSRGGSRCFCRDGLLLADVNVRDKNVAVRLVDLAEGAWPSLLIITSLDESTCLLRGSNSWLAIIDTIHGYFFFIATVATTAKNKTKQRASFSRLKPHLRNIFDRLAAVMQRNDRMNGYLREWVNEWMNESKVKVWMETRGPFMNKIVLHTFFCLFF